MCAFQKFLYMCVCFNLELNKQAFHTVHALLSLFLSLTICLSHSQNTLKKYRNYTNIVFRSAFFFVLSLENFTCPLWLLLAQECPCKASFFSSSLLLLLLFPGVCVFLFSVLCAVALLEVRWKDYKVFRVVTMPNSITAKRRRPSDAPDCLPVAEECLQK